MADNSPRLPSVMSLRDYFAGQALNALIGDTKAVAESVLKTGRRADELLAQMSYELADAMLTERERDTR